MTEPPTHKLRRGATVCGGTEGTFTHLWARTTCQACVNTHLDALAARRQKRDRRRDRVKEGNYRSSPFWAELDSLWRDNR